MKSLRSLAGSVIRRLRSEKPTGPSAEDLLLEIVGGENQLVAVDVGGAVGLQPHWQKMREAALFYIYEPCEASFMELANQKEENPDAYRNFRYIREALAEEDGKRTLYVTNVPTGTSLYPPRMESINVYPENDYFFPVIEEDIDVVTAEHSLKELSVERVDCIKLDTQGSELDILRGLGGYLGGLLGVELEISIFQTYDGAPTSLVSVIQFMESHGLSLYDLRTTRTIGAANRLEGDLLERVLGANPTTPGVSHRLNEVDAVFMVDIMQFLDRDEFEYREFVRLLAVYCTYNFFAEALYGVESAWKSKHIERIERDRLIELISKLKEVAVADATEATEALEFTQGRVWGQYMWVPYPCA